MRHNVTRVFCASDALWRTLSATLKHPTFILSRIMPILEQSSINLTKTRAFVKMSDSRSSVSIFKTLTFHTLCLLRPWNYGFLHIASPTGTHMPCAQRLSQQNGLSSYSLDSLGSREGSKSIMCKKLAILRSILHSTGHYSKPDASHTYLHELCLHANFLSYYTVNTGEI